MVTKKEIPEISEASAMFILETLVQARKEYIEDQGTFVEDEMIKEINSVIKWIAAGGFE